MGKADLFHDLKLPRGPADDSFVRWRTVIDLMQKVAAREIFVEGAAARETADGIEIDAPNKNGAPEAHPLRVTGTAGGYLVTPDFEGRLKYKGVRLADGPVIEPPPWSGGILCAFYKFEDFSGPGTSNSGYWYPATFLEDATWPQVDYLTGENTATNFMDRKLTYAVEFPFETAGPGPFVVSSSPDGLFLGGTLALPIAEISATGRIAQLAFGSQTDPLALGSAFRL